MLEQNETKMYTDVVNNTVHRVPEDLKQEHMNEGTSGMTGKENSSI